MSRLLSGFVIILLLATSVAFAMGGASDVGNGRSDRSMPMPAPMPKGAPGGSDSENGQVKGTQNGVWTIAAVLVDFAATSVREGDLIEGTVILNQAVSVVECGAGLWSPELSRPIAFESCKPSSNGTATVLKLYYRVPNPSVSRAYELKALWIRSEKGGPATSISVSKHDAVRVETAAALPEVALKAVSLSTLKAKANEIFSLKIELQSEAVFSAGTLNFRVETLGGETISSKLELPPAQGFYSVQYKNEVILEIAMRVPSRFADTKAIHFESVRVRTEALQESELQFPETLTVTIER